MKHHSMGSAPNFFVASMVLLAVNLMWVFMLLWALYGWVPIILLAVALNHAITRIEIWREAEEAKYQPPQG